MPCKHEAEEFFGYSGTVVEGRVGFLLSNIALVEEDRVEASAGIVVPSVDKLDSCVYFITDIFVFNSFSFLHVGELAHDLSDYPRQGVPMTVACLHVRGCARASKKRFPD